MELRHLKLIKAVVEEGGITKAANTLFLTQSALSHQLKEAEYQLGTNIFDRINKKLVLTQAGEKCYVLAVDVIRQIDATEQEIKQIIMGENGVIRICVGCFTGYQWLPSLMRSFNTMFPNVEIKILTEEMVDPTTKLLSGEVDLVITVDPWQNEAIEYAPFFKDELVALVSKTHEWRKKKYILAEDFADQNLIIYSLPMESVMVHSSMLAPAKISPQKVTVLPMTEATIELVKANMGVKTISKWAAKPYLRHSDIKAIKIGSNGLKLTHYIASLKNKNYPVYYQKFIELLSSESIVLGNK
jgi:LysR family transcriptional regulator, regulator for metE and metH